MTISRGEIKGKILSLVNKSPGYQGFFSDEKMDMVIQERLDYIATRMFFESPGWQRDLRYLDVPDNVVSVQIPQDVGVIHHVRYKISTWYQPLVYSDDPRQVEYDSQSGMTQYPTTYKIVGSRIFFNPPISPGGAQMLELEVSVYPPELRSDGSLIESKFNRGLLHYLVYSCASVLFTTVGKTNAEWKQYEGEWFQAMLDLVSKRVTTSTPVLDFDG